MKVRSIIVVSSLAIASTLCACKKGDSAAGAAASAQGSAAPGAAATAGGSVQNALSDLEGVVGLSIKSKEQPVNLTLQVKKGMVRFDFPADLAKRAQLNGNAYAIVNAAEGKLYGVIDERKLVVEVDFKKLQDQMKAMAPQAHAAKAGEPEKVEPPPKITKTGHMDKVAGYTCEDWQIVTNDGGKATVCVNAADTSWLKIPAMNLPKDAQWAAELIDGKHFPLRMIAFNKAGAEDGRIELTQLEKKPLADAVFQLPPGYQRLDLEQFMQSMMNAAGGMGAPGAMPPGATPGAKVTPEMQATIKRLQAQTKKGAH